MSNEEFETYVALMSKLLQWSPEQRDKISGELQDHLQLRVADLVGEGVSQSDAIKQAVEEFGDAAVMAKNFQTVLNLKRRRWMMRFATISMAGAFLAAILTMAMWPDNARFGSPNHSVAQESGAAQSNAAANLNTIKVSDATQRTRQAEQALKQIVDLNYDETAFAEVMSVLSETTGLNFLLSSSASDDSLGEDEPINFNLSGIPLNKGLELMLRTKNATYVIDEGVVVIISLDDAEDTKWLRLKMFDCREFVKMLPETQPPYRGGGGFGGGGFGGGGLSGGGGGVFSISQGVVASPQGTRNQDASNDVSDKQQSASELLDQKLSKIIALMKAEADRNRPAPSSEHTLRNLVQQMVDHDSWIDTGQGLAEIDVVNGILVVKQTEPLLREIENFLADLEGNILMKKMPTGNIDGRSTRPRKKLKARTTSSEADPFGGADQDQGAKDPFGESRGESDPFN